MRRTQDKKSIPSTSGNKSKNAAAIPAEPERGKISTATASTKASSSLEKAYGSTKPKSVVGKPGKPSSIIAASKASYAEKYGPINATMSKPPPANTATTTTVPKKLNKPKQGQQPTNSVPSNTKSTRGVIPVQKSPNTRLGQNITAPQQQRLKATTTPQAIQKSSVSLSQITKTTSSPSQIGKLPSKVEAEGDVDYDEDFEEDYQSDFEQDPSTDDDTNDAQSTTRDAEGPDVSKQKYAAEMDDQDDVSELEGQRGPDFLVESSEDDEALIDQHYSIASLPTNQPGFFRNTGGASGVRKLAEAGEETKSTQQQVSYNRSENISTTSPPNFPTHSNSIADPAGPRRRTFDFESAKAEKGKENKLTRSQKLQQLIVLHKINSVTLFHLENSPEQYAFSVFGTLSHHKSVQTEKLQTNFSGQTDRALSWHKWTQKPPAWSTDQAQQSDIHILREESLGVGGEPGIANVQYEEKKGDQTWSKPSLQQVQWEYEVGTSWSRISKFISRASRKVLYVLESQKRLALSDGQAVGSRSEAKLSRGLAVFNSLEMACLTCSGDFVACANFYPVEKSRRKSDAKSVITIWNVKEPSCPKYFLRMWGKVTAITLFVYGHLVVAGGRDGGLAIWDLDEHQDYHKLYQDQTIRTATIDTALLDQSHKEAIVGINVVSQTEDSSMILSMDRSGIFKSWSVLRSSEIIENPQYPKHTAYWSRLNICHKTTLNLNDSLAEKVLLVSTFMTPTNDPNKNIGSTTTIPDFICGTVNGFAIRSSFLKNKKDEAKVREYYKMTSEKINRNLSNGEGDGFTGSEEKGGRSGDDTIVSKKLFIQKYYPPEYNTSITAMDINSSLNILLTGSTDGKCRLYSLQYRKVLLTINCDAQPLRVHFSKKRLSVIYVALKEGIQIYDLVKNEKTPWKVISLPNIRDLEIYFSVFNEFTVVLASNELKASMSDFPALTDQEYKKFLSRLDVLCS